MGALKAQGFKKGLYYFMKTSIKQDQAATWNA